MPPRDGAGGRLARRAMAAVAAAAAAAARRHAPREPRRAIPPAAYYADLAFLKPPDTRALMGLAPDRDPDRESGVRRRDRSVPPLPVARRRAAGRIRRPQGLPAERSAGEGRSHEHGAQPGGALSRCSTGGSSSWRSGFRRRGSSGGPGQSAAAGLARRRLAGGTLAAAEAGVHGADCGVDRRSCTLPSSQGMSSALVRSSAKHLDLKMLSDRLWTGDRAPAARGYALWAIWVLQDRLTKSSSLKGIGSSSPLRKGPRRCRARPSFSPVLRSNVPRHRNIKSTSGSLFVSF